MATIIAGHFCQLSEAEHAARTLVQSGFDENKISYFYTGPAGRHETYPGGGDHAESDGIHGRRGVTVGGAIGAGLGLAATPLAGPAGPAGGALLGAHLGSLIGTLSNTEEADESSPTRQSGMMIAVEVVDAASEAQAVETLRNLGADDIERAEGTIEESDWRDFDAGSAPSFVDRPRPDSRA